VRSSDAEARIAPSGLKATALTARSWPISVFMRVCRAAFHRRTFLSSEAEASTVPSGLKATSLTLSRWPLSTVSVSIWRALPSVIGS